MSTTTVLDRAASLARISLAFGRVERVTRHEDGRRPETDTDHTVMLGLVACELAPATLDRSKIAAFALVHDLPEVYAGDTQTLVISPEAAAAKQVREDVARTRLVGELCGGSWIAGLLAVYEQQREPEARFVRLIDKVLPKLTHALNGCAAAVRLTDRAGFIETHVRQFRKLSEEYPEFPDALALLREAMLHAEECWTLPGEHASKDSTGGPLDAGIERTRCVTVCDNQALMLEAAGDHDGAKGARLCANVLRALSPVPPEATK